MLVQYDTDYEILVTMTSMKCYCNLGSETFKMRVETSIKFI